MICACYIRDISISLRDGASIRPQIAGVFEEILLRYDNDIYAKISVIGIINTSHVNFWRSYASPTSFLSVPKIQIMFTSHLQFLSVDRKCFLLSPCSPSPPHYICTCRLQKFSVAKVSPFSSTCVLCYPSHLKILSCCDYLNHASYVSPSRIGAIFFD